MCVHAHVCVSAFIVCIQTCISTLVKMYVCNFIFNLSAPYSRQAPQTVTADDVIISNVRDNGAGHVTFDIYIQIDDDNALSATAVKNAIEVYFTAIIM